ncbi:MAG: tol-pal system protein YbgF, partial [Legionellales bacterium]
MLNVRHFLVIIGCCATSVAQAESVQAQLDALTQIEEIRAELQALRGEVEVTQFELKQLEQKQRDYYDDLNQRLSQKEQTTPAAPAAVVAASTAPTVPTTTAPNAYSGPEGKPAAAPIVAPGAIVDTTTAVAEVNNAGNDLGAYQAAYNFLQNKKYPEAIAGFNAYLSAYPKGDYVANSEYWLGEIHLIQHQYPQAEKAFSRVVNDYPAHQKAADALLKLGYVYEASG